MIRDNKDNEIDETEDYDELLKILQTRPYNISCTWQSDDYNNNTGARLTIHWTNSYAGPFSVSIYDF